ncbi:MAG TPA: FAD:protein FMN transferase [Planctomycetaceae bacterium]|nr:FAD:protein FMN transferase [Planctomycetaceae bacterium]
MSHSRRSFLSGRALVSDIETAPPRPGSAPLLTVTREAMAGEFEVDLNFGQYPEGAEAALAALDEVTRLEEKLSVFRPKSTISYINAVAAYEPVPLDGELFELLRRCLEWERETQGAVDITATPLWRVWGFARREGRVPSSAEIDDALKTVGSRFVVLEEADRTVRFLKPGVELNLGCVGKGFALDVAADHLRRRGIENFLMHGGLSSVLAAGRQEGLRRTKTPDNGSVSGEGWKVGIAHPMHPGKRLGELALHNRSLGTSGTRHQYFRYRGKRYGHILDPRNGRPAEGTISVTVLAGEAATADALSTAFFVMTPDEIAALLERRREDDLGVILVRTSEKGNGYEITRFGNTSLENTGRRV